jgi:hypothetical protein
VITALDAVHDQHSPQEVLRRVRAALAPGGVFVMVDAKFSSDLAGNICNPLAALCYAISVLYCTPVSLAGGGAGLGAMWGTERAGQMLAEGRLRPGRGAGLIPAAELHLRLPALTAAPGGPGKRVAERGPGVIIFRCG